MTVDLEAFASWLDNYGRAWETGDADAAAALFAPDATYHETPFNAPMVGREAIHAYWFDGASTTQSDIAFTYEILAVESDRGIAHWTARFVRVPSGNRVRLDGVLAARFDGDLCIEFREWWHRAETAEGPV